MAHFLNPKESRYENTTSFIWEHPHYAKEILETLINAEDMEVSLVFTQPDRPVGRKKVLTPPSVKILAEENGITVLQPNRLSEEGMKEAIADTNPDFIIVAAFGQILA